jgi:2,4-dienoyl-CoA reductase-like NADH-dependent reductase (Old Yellow Enzyme family)
MALDALFKPFEFKSLKLPNRVVMAPMTRSFSPGGVATDDVAAYYRRRAEGQVGLIVTEGTGVARDASLNDANIPRFHGEKELAAWKKVVDEVHAAGGLIAPQLWHVGAAKGKDVLGKVDSPSGLSKKGGNPFTEPMTDEDVADTIAAFASAAADAKAGLRRHRAARRPRLPDRPVLLGRHQCPRRRLGRSDHRRAQQFRRRDPQGRPRRRGRGLSGDHPPVAVEAAGLRGKNAETPQLLEAWLQPLADAGADIFHCSQRRFWEPEFEGSDLNFAGWAKKLTGAPTITVGSVGLSGEFIAAFGGEGSQPASIDGLLERLDRGEFDLVGVGRALLAGPRMGGEDPRRPQ